MNNKKTFSILFRYVLLVITGMGNLFLFYKLFTFPTLRFSALILSFFNETIILDSYILFGDSLLEIAKSCIAGSAYYLLFVLAMAIPLVLLKRIKLILFCFISFFLVNVIRIVVMAFILKTPYFEWIHLFLWHIFSTIFLILIWFGAVKIFKIKEVPFYTDFLTIKKTYNSKTRKKDNQTSNYNSKSNSRNTFLFI